MLLNEKEVVNHEKGQGKDDSLVSRLVFVKKDKVSRLAFGKKRKLVVLHLEKKNKVNRLVFGKR